jgi:hypothetical protein
VTSGKTELYWPWRVDATAELIRSLTAPAGRCTSRAAATPCRSPYGERTDPAPWSASAIATASSCRSRAENKTTGEATAKVRHRPPATDHFATGTYREEVAGLDRRRRVKSHLMLDGFASADA